MTNSTTAAEAEVMRLVGALEAAVQELTHLRQLCAEVYQVAGALGAAPRVLDNLWAAADGKPLPHASLLPYPAAAAHDRP